MLDWPGIVCPRIQPFLLTDVGHKEDTAGPKPLRSHPGRLSLRVKGLHSEVCMEWIAKN